jgi:hypothetical protein
VAKENESLEKGSKQRKADDDGLVRPWEVSGLRAWVVLAIRFAQVRPVSGTVPRGSQESQKERESAANKGEEMVYC